MGRPANQVNFDKPVIALHSEEHKPDLNNIAILKPKEKEKADDDDKVFCDPFISTLRNRYLKWFEETFGDLTDDECERALSEMCVTCK